ncbi:MAG: ribosomal small subunit protein bTHX [Bacteroidetes bacterium CG2_30_33_31]|nr:MAG: ribosomal small subunit protein bTHX [Bacteroidetes bacterium CG2_30_33_31]
MGKGDIKTKRGKIINKSFGNRRPKKISESYVQVAKPMEVKSVETEVEKPIKKAVAKKPTVKKLATKKTTPAKKS